MIWSPSSLNKRLSLWLNYAKLSFLLLSTSVTTYSKCTCLPHTLTFSDFFIYNTHIHTHARACMHASYWLFLYYKVNCIWDLSVLFTSVPYFNHPAKELKISLCVLISSLSYALHHTQELSTCLLIFYRPLSLFGVSSINLSLSLSGPSNLGNIVEEVTHPCNPNPCPANELCEVNRKGCPTGDLCLPYSCVQGKREVSVSEGQMRFHAALWGLPL